MGIDSIDIDKLREFLLDYYESAFFCGIEIAKSDLVYVESLNDEELLMYAIEHKFDLENFKKNGRTK